MNYIVSIFNLHIKEQRELLEKLQTNAKQISEKAHVDSGPHGLGTKTQTVPNSTSSVKRTRWSRERPGAGEVRHGRRRGGARLHGTAQDELLDRVLGQMKPLATSNRTAEQRCRMSDGHGRRRSAGERPPSCLRRRVGWWTALPRGRRLCLPLHRVHLPHHPHPPAARTPPAAPSPPPSPQTEPASSALVNQARWTMVVVGTQRCVGPSATGSDVGFVGGQIRRWWPCWKGARQRGPTGGGAEDVAQARGASGWRAVCDGGRGRRGGR